VCIQMKCTLIAQSHLCNGHSIHQDKCQEPYQYLLKSGYRQAGHLQNKYTLQVKDSENVYAELVLPHPFQIPFTNKVLHPNTQCTQIHSCHSTTVQNFACPVHSPTTYMSVPRMFFICDLKHSRTTVWDTFASDITSHLLTQLHMLECS
jgi:hypothetical protein